MARSPRRLREIDREQNRRRLGASEIGLGAVAAEVDTIRSARAAAVVVDGEPVGTRTPCHPDEERRPQGHLWKPHAGDAQQSPYRRASARDHALWVDLAVIRFSKPQLFVGSSSVSSSRARSAHSPEPSSAR